MKADERRKAIAALLLSEQKPVSGGALARKFEVSRQIIVSDIAALKSNGHEIISTSQGYIIKTMPGFERVFKLKHTREETEDELNSVVDLGGTVTDVFVWHKVYGRIEAKLNIASRLDVANFMDGVRSGKSTELMDITGGYHYHTVRADSEEILDRIYSVLNEKGYVLPGD